ncbi:MAG: hypothetical protein A2Y62_11575 [Candidatus Fischerbacteria bacterium RBG_13_37_8]|uniref:DNA alkylation repair protein n=1 Tax=Candidatus Fischerbacteria bacterium RBG_13_37_8 TaxID=1817863 RepID=A0A1F5V5C9_9BACT|nr:MAG: hypothetical protein A2Y62_11575 [Candidatus Fischerbacteria bacterium RBG_13_37_8]
MVTFFPGIREYFEEAFIILNEICSELKKNVDPVYKETIKRFFKEDQEINLLGVRTPVVHAIGKKYYQTIKNKSKHEILVLCEELLEKGYSEEQGIAIGWASRIKSKYESGDFKLFTEWLDKYIKNWGHCDGYCGGVLGPFVYKYPEFLPKVKGWTKSENRWFRRASAVLMITLAKDEKYLADIFEIAERLLMDEDDMVQKGYGWLLKEASKKYQSAVFSYVMQNKDRMPRTALRYAIEKMPPDLKKKGMER